MERSQPLRVVLYKATGVGFFFFFFFFHFHFLFFFVFCFSVSWIWLMFRQCVHVWSWLVGGLFSFFFFGVFVWSGLYSFPFGTTRPEQKEDGCEQLSRGDFPYYCRPDRFISAANSA